MFVMDSSELHTTILTADTASIACPLPFCCTMAQSGWVSLLQVPSSLVLLILRLVP